MSVCVYKINNQIEALLMNILYCLIFLPSGLY